MSPRRLLLLCAVGLAVVGGAPAHAAYPGVNGNLIFSRCGQDQCSTGHLYTVGSDGSDPFEFVSEPTFDDDASYSADGARVAFQRCDQSCGIATANADGSNVQQLTDDENSGPPVVDDYPSFSPDGSKILFSRFSSSDGIGVWIMGSDGSGAHKLFDISTVAPRQARFSPDGSKIAFIDTNQALAVANADGSGTPQEIDTPPSAFDSFPDWSPDGSRIVFVRGNFSVDRRVWIVPSDGSTQAVELMDPGSGTSDDEPAFSPDGTKVTFERYPTGNQDVSPIYVAGSDGSGATRVTCEDCLDFHPEWRPLHPAPVPPPAPPKPPAFAGVKLAVARLTVSARGLVQIPESCPFFTKDSCAGTLTLKTAGAVAAKRKHKRVLTLGKAHFSIPAGKTVKVKLRLSKSAMRLLRSRHTLRTVALIVSHDGSGATKSTLGRLVLKAPKKRKHH